MFLNKSTTNSLRCGIGLALLFFSGCSSNVVLNGATWDWRKDFYVHNVIVADLNTAELTDTDLEGLSYSTGLKELYIAGNPALTKNGLSNIHALKQIEALDISSNPQFNDDDLFFLANYPVLKTLIVREMPVDGSFLIDLKGLVVLDATMSMISDQSLSQWPAKNRLVELYLNGCPIGRRGVASLNAANMLERLDLSDTDVHGADLALLGQLPRLLELRLRGATLTAGGIQGISLSRSIAYLDLRYCRPDGDQPLDITLLAAMPGLKRIDIEAGCFTYDSIKGLKKNRPDLSVHLFESGSEK